MRATYRISMQRALVPAPIYEMAQRCIFKTVHRALCDREPVEAFIQRQLTGEPATLDERPTDDQLTKFFVRHAALETAAALHLIMTSDPGLRDERGQAQLALLSLDR